MDLRDESTAHPSVCVVAWQVLISSLSPCFSTPSRLNPSVRHSVSAVMKALGGWEGTYRRPEKVSWGIAVGGPSCHVVVPCEPSGDTTSRDVRPIIHFTSRQTSRPGRLLITGHFSDQLTAFNPPPNPVSRSVSIVFFILLQLRHRVGPKIVSSSSMGFDRCMKMSGKVEVSKLRYHSLCIGTPTTSSMCGWPRWLWKLLLWRRAASHGSWNMHGDSSLLV